MTVGISPKAKLATLFSAVATVLAVVIQWLVTGEYDKAELATTIIGVTNSLLAFAGAFLGAPGDVLSVQGVPSDSQLSAESLSQAEAARPVE